MSQLYTTGVPVPFDCVIAKRIANPVEVERALHIAFGPNRINPKREFFQIQSDQVLAILKAFPGEEVTGLVESQNQSAPEESAAAERLRTRRRPNLNWKEMGIPVGATLNFEAGDETVTVVDDRRVMFRGQPEYLTSATRKALDLDYSVHPGPYWRYKGELVSEIYNRTYALAEEAED